jgi:hypothetical protein
MNMRHSIFLSVLLFLLYLCAIPASAWGPMYVTGPSATQPGQPFRWSSNPIYYSTDQGSLGNQTNSQANSLVATAFQTWQNVTTASLNIQRAGSLSYNVTASNIETFMNSIGNCSNTGQPVNSIVYDQDGSIIEALGYDNNSILGFSGIMCADTTTGTYTRGWAVLNGRYIDGSTSHSTVSLDEFKAVFIHEFGHLLGLDHSQINLNCLTGSSCSATDLLGVPTMFPYLLDITQANLKTDDKAAISMLYPASSFSSSMGRIQGHILFSDGQTPAEGYNVIARQVENPRVVAVSSVSGFLFTPNAGNQFFLAYQAVDDPTADPYFVSFGSHDTNLIGFYDIPGLPPGNYTVEVEAINNDEDTAFISGNGVGPIGGWMYFQFKMPGSCSLQYLNYPSAPTDSCSANSTVAAAGGYITNANTNIILLGTKPRYDQWEDEAE